MYNEFDILAAQFRLASPTENNALNADEFHDFFEHSHRYLSDIVINSNEKRAMVKIIFRMIGLLSIGKESFDRYDRHSTALANGLMFCVRESFDKLCQSMDELEWVLFEGGLTMFLCIELLQYPLYSPNENKVTFLQQISDQNRREYVAYELLNRLQQLDQPIFGDSNWTDLFTMVDPPRCQSVELN